MDRLVALKSLASGESMEEGANLTDVLDIGATALALRKVLTGPDNVRPPAQDKTGLLDQLKALVTKDKAPVAASGGTEATKTVVQTGLAKSFDEDKGLITAVVLRPDVVDLHGDIYDSAEVEKACFNFNTVCRKSNVQHEKMTDFDIVESYISKTSFILGDGEVHEGDWVATMHVDPKKHADTWKAVKAGEFTGFSIGCKADVEDLS